MSLVDLIQVTCNERKRARLKIQMEGREARIYFDSGDLVHAQHGTEEGVEVLYRLLHLAEGDFELEKSTESPKRTIHDGWRGILLEGMSRLDVARRDGSTSSSRGGDGGAVRGRPVPNGIAEVQPSRDQQVAHFIARLPDVLGAVIINRKGVMVGHDLSAEPETEGAIAGFCSSGAVQLGKVLALGDFQHGRIWSATVNRAIVAGADRIASLLTPTPASEELVRKARAALEGKS